MSLATNNSLSDVVAHTAPPIVTLGSIALYDVEPVLHILAYALTSLWTTICIVSWWRNRNKDK